MSSYSDPNFNQDFSQGYSDQGGHGDYSAGYDFAGGYDTAAAGEEVAYGDEGPLTDQASGDEALAQGYEQQNYDQQSYAQQGYDQQDYAQGYEQGYGDDQAYDQEGYSDEETAEDEEPVEAQAPSDGNNKKPLVLAAVGLAVLVGLGGAGYFLLAQPSEGGEGGFDLSSITRMIPFLGAKDSEETLMALQDNTAAVKMAIDAYARENGRLPATSSAVMAQLRKSGKELMSPYNPEEPLVVEMGEVPTVPGAIAYSLQGRTYTLSVADISGQPLAIEGQPFTLSGRVSAARPAKQAAAPKKPGAAPAGKAPNAPAGKGGAQVAAGNAPEATPTPLAQPNLGKRPNAGKPSAPGKKKDELEHFIAENVASPSPTTSAKVEPAEVVVRRNQEFDRWRSKGIALVYEQKTAESIAAFKKALALRPNDPSVTRWLATIQDVIDKHTTEERERYMKEREEMLKNAPQMPPVPVRVGGPTAGGAQSDDAMKMYNELKKQDKVPLLAPPRVDE